MPKDLNLLSQGFEAQSHIFSPGSRAIGTLSSHWHGLGGSFQEGLESQLQSGRQNFREGCGSESLLASAPEQQTPGGPGQGSASTCHSLPLFTPLLFSLLQFLREQGWGKYFSNFHQLSIRETLV